MVGIIYFQLIDVYGVWLQPLNAFLNCLLTALFIFNFLTFLIMKNVKLFFAAMFMLTLISFGAEAQQRANVGQLVSGLITVNIGTIQADIETGDITLVNVEDVLNNNEIRILNNVLNNNEILSRNQNVLNNLLRDADILTDNQVVVGILSSGAVVFRNL